MMVKQEFKVDGVVKKTRHTEAAGIAFPPFERSEAAAQKIHELMHAEPFPDMDEIFNTPELLAQVEQAARDVEIGGHAPRKAWATRVTCKDGKGRVVSAIPPDEQEVFLDGDEEIEQQPAAVEKVASSEQQESPYPEWVIHEYMLTRARMITSGAEYVEDLRTLELASLCAMSRKRFMPLNEWVSLRYPE